MHAIQSPGFGPCRRRFVFVGEDAAWRLRALLRLERGDAASRRNAKTLTEPAIVLFMFPCRSKLSRTLSAGWRVHARCIDGHVEYTRSKAKCRYQAELSLETLVWTRGRNMPLAGLGELHPDSALSSDTQRADFLQKTYFVESPSFGMRLPGLLPEDSSP
jgi:hypothetical protein